MTTRWVCGCDCHKQNKTHCNRCAVNHLTSEDLYNIEDPIQKLSRWKKNILDVIGIILITGILWLGIQALIFIWSGGLSG